VARGPISMKRTNRGGILSPVERIVSTIEEIEKMWGGGCGLDKKLTFS